MKLSPDDIVVFSIGAVPVTATIIYTLCVMAVLVLGSRLITRRLRVDEDISLAQNFLEAAVQTINQQIQEISGRDPSPYLPFIGTIFLFILTSNLLSLIPNFTAPTSSLSTTVALALLVMLAVPLYGISQRGVSGYMRNYLRPSVFMLPFNILAELSRTVALAVRLYGNTMSGAIIGAILLSLIPLFFPVVMQLLGLITGAIQAYIFAVLAMVYIASASSDASRQDTKPMQHPQSTMTSRGE